MSADERKTILVVDDSPTILQLVNASLSQLGYRVVAAASGEEGLKAVERETFDLILLDVMMPGIDGYTMLTKLQQSVPAPVPVIVISGKGEAELGDLFLGKSAGWLQKPFSPSALADEVERVFGGPVV